MNIGKEKHAGRKKRSKALSMHTCDLRGCCSIRDGLTRLTDVKYAAHGTTRQVVIRKGLK